MLFSENSKLLALNPKASVNQTNTNNQYRNNKNNDTYKTI